MRVLPSLVGALSFACCCYALLVSGGGGANSSKQREASTILRDAMQQQLQDEYDAMVVPFCRPPLVLTPAGCITLAPDTFSPWPITSPRVLGNARPRPRSPANGTRDSEQQPMRQLHQADWQHHVESTIVKTRKRHVRGASIALAPTAAVSERLSFRSLDAQEQWDAFLLGHRRALSQLTCDCTPRTSCDPFGERCTESKDCSCEL